MENIQPVEPRILLVDKPAGMTSHDVVDRVRRLFKTRRVGHAGTLDPFATGLLILGIGAATKKLGELTGQDKTYEATARLGATSDTHDPEGHITETEIQDTGYGLQVSNSGTSEAEIQASESEAGDSAKRRFSEAEIRGVLASFVGGYEQKAPAFSAKKVGGKRLYALARAGEDVEHLRPTKFVRIDAIELISYEWPVLKFRVSCGSGTYIRSLAHDIGQKLGCGAYLTALRRTRIGNYHVEDAELKTL